MRSVYMKIFFTLCRNSKDGWVKGEADCEWQLISLHFIYYHHGTFRIKVNFLTSRGPVSFSKKTLLHVVSYTGQKPFHTHIFNAPYLTSWFKTNSYITLCTVTKIICWLPYFKGHLVLTYPTHIETAASYSTISPRRLPVNLTLKVQPLHNRQN